jgi:peptidoglycan glycosyltransferase
MTPPPRSRGVLAVVRRNTELGLVLLGAVIVAGTYTLAGFGRDASLPANIVPFLCIVLGLVLVGHLAVRRLAPAADGLLLPVAGLLNGLGYVFIARLDDKLAGLQATWTAVAMAAFVLTLVVVRRVRDLERLRYTMALTGIGLLVLPLVPGVGKEINGAQIWVGLGPVNFQPGEFAKLALAVFLASYLVEKRELLAMTTWRVGPLLLPDPKYLGPVALAWVCSLGVMVFEKDLGSSLLFFGLFVVTIWVATERVTYVVLGMLLFAAGAYGAWTQFSHVQDRVAIWLDPWQDPLDDGFQVVQSAFALAWGGFTGTGPGLGSEVRIPAAETDFIFAVIGEELGFAGALLVICAFVVMVGSGLRIAIETDHAFEKVLATGLTALLGLQAFVIIGGVIRLLPLTGVTLPFVSYGGSSLVSNWVLLALLLRISDTSMQREAASRVGAEAVEV